MVQRWADCSRIKVKDHENHADVMWLVSKLHCGHVFWTHHRFHFPKETEKNAPACFFFFRIILCLSRYSWDYLKKYKNLAYCQEKAVCAPKMKEEREKLELMGRKWVSVPMGRSEGFGIRSPVWRNGPYPFSHAWCFQDMERLRQQPSGKTDSVLSFHSG